MKEKEPTIKQLDEMRATNYRPTVLVCCINNKKVLMLFKKEYRLWMFVQGGIQSKEKCEDAAFRELEEEMGAKFVKKCSKKMIYVGDDQVEFLPEKQTGEELTDSKGKVFKMIGKHYYFFVTEVSSAELDIKETEFDENYWFDSKPALSLASKIYQPGKRRVTLKAITLLKEQDLID